MSASLLLWFLADTGLSVKRGVPYNAWLNLVLFSLFAVPIVITWREFGVKIDG